MPIGKIIIKMNDNYRNKKNTKKVTPLIKKKVKSSNSYDFII